MNQPFKKINGIMFTDGKSIDLKSDFLMDEINLIYDESEIDVITTTVTLKNTKDLSNWLP